MLDFVSFAVTLALVSSANTKNETPDTPKPRVCTNVEGPDPKTEKDVKTQPYCGPTPSPAPTPTPKKVEK